MRDVEALAGIEWARVVLDEAQVIKNPANDTSQQLRRIPARSRLALTGTPIENGLGDLWAILDFVNPGLVGNRPQFIARLSSDGSAARVEAEDAMRALNGILVFRRTKAEPEIADELPDQIDELDHCAMTPEQIGLYQAVLDKLVTGTDEATGEAPRKGQILAAITALKQICNHPSAYQRDDRPLAGRSGKLARLEEIVDAVFAAGERVLVFTHFAEWGIRLAEHLSDAHRNRSRVLPRRPGAHRARPAHRRLPGWRRSARARAVAEGGRHRPEPHRREPRRAVRPLVEPGRRGPGA